MIIKVSFHGKTQEFVMEETDRASDLMQVFRREFDVAESTAHFKAVAKGRDVTHETADLKALVGDGGKVMVIASDAAEVDSVCSRGPARTVPSAGMPGNIAAVSARRRKQSGPQASVSIHKVQALPSLPLADQAQGILVKIASDPGIVGVIDKHNFTVGLLTELPPTETTLLGLNKNKGEAILLKLRTLGSPTSPFLPYSEIRDTMLHELTHCVHGPHDNSFYTLFRQLCKECQKFDWTTGGRRIGGADFYNPAGAPSSSDFSPAAVQMYSQGYVSRTGVTLGGDSDLVEKLSGAGFTPGQVAGGMAILRLTDEEKRIERGCAVVKSGEHPIPRGAAPTAAEIDPFAAAARGAAAPNGGASSPPAALPSPSEEPSPPPLSPPAARPVKQAKTSPASNPVVCPACGDTLPAGCTERFVANHVESCTAMQPPPVAAKCPICDVTLPEGSSERYVNNHVEQCIKQMAVDDGVDTHTGDETSSANAPPVLRLGGGVPVASSSSADAELKPATTEAAPASSTMNTVAPNASCPICNEPFPPSCSERYVSNHVDQCLLRLAS
ncbi:Ubiquitin and WLM domain-containing metalloprotease [Diplonema papillatum]|nr:Ubiquitin and WLM domain-containing metalloprotease [Diplonema papillatum]